MPTKKYSVVVLQDAAISGRTILIVNWAKKILWKIFILATLGIAIEVPILHATQTIKDNLKSQNRNKNSSKKDIQILVERIFGSGSLKIDQVFLGRVSGTLRT